MATTVQTQISVLGPIQVWRDGAAVDLGTPRQRAILAALALSPGRTVPLATLVERVWGGAAPATSTTTLQRYVSSLRHALEPGRSARQRPSLIATGTAGYTLQVAGADRDVAVLEEAVATARALLAGVPDMMRPQATADGVDDAARAAERLREALALWRGTPYAELVDDLEAAAERARLEDLRVNALELRVVAMLAIGRHAEVIGEVEAMTAQHPLRERWWALRAIALVRSGRQGEALEVLGSLRAVLAEQLGVDPSAPLRDLHTAILRQDPALDWVPPSTVVPGAGTGEAGQGWPFVGRAAEVDALSSLLEQSRRGRAGAAFVAGEAGIGKTRLIEEVTSLADRLGVASAVVACSPRPTPALWPLRTVLSAAGAEAPTEDGATEFETREVVIAALLEAAAESPYLLVVEDVQWADPATIAVLEELVRRREDAALALVLTRRTGAGDDLTMSRLAAAVARNGGVRLDLDGLTSAEAGELVRALAGAGADASQLWSRSGGNPFLIAELARAGGRLSGSLVDVLQEQVMALPPATVTALQAASVMGESFDVRHLAPMLARDEPETLDLLQGAVRAGLAVERSEVGSTHAFTHPVIGDVVRAEQSSAALSSWHALAARASSDRGGLRDRRQRGRVVAHWQRAGRGHAADGWRAIVGAAAYARADSDHAEELGHLRAALCLMDVDDDAGDHERFELLMHVADACRGAGDWRGVSETVDEALWIAERLDDDRLAGRAAGALADGAVWPVRPFGYVHEPTRDHLERLLARLDLEGVDDVALRCRVQVALALELYHDPTQTEVIDRLVDDAVRDAESTADLRLQLSCYHGAFVATWRPATVERRAAIAASAVQVARRLGDPRAIIGAETLSLAVASELGQVARVRSGLRRVVQVCVARRLVVPEAVLRLLSLGWSALDGEPAGASTQVATLTSLVRVARIPHLAAAVDATIVTAAVLDGDPVTLRRSSSGLGADGGVPSALLRAAVLARLGRHDAARALLADAEPELAGHTLLGGLNAALACQVGASLGATPLTEEAYAFLLPHAGRTCSAGPAALLGPTDLYLALGAVALGRQAEAEEHLTDAIRLIGEHGLLGVHHELDQVRTLVRAGRVLSGTSTHRSTVRSPG